MLPLFDMLANAQNGNAMREMARQFGLSEQQTQDAMEALLPAFSQGLRRNASDPYGLGAFLSALSTGQHAKYFEDPQRAFSSQGTEEGNGILGHLFGSKELSRAVAEQAARNTGIAQDTLKQMLPAMAAMIMGGLFKQSTGQMRPAAGFGGEGNPLQEIIEQMMRQGTTQPQRREEPKADTRPVENPFGRVLEEMFGGQPSGRRAPEPAQTPYGDNPLGRIFEEMLRGGQRGPAEPAPKPKTNPSGRQRTPYDDLFGEMFETGAKSRDEYQRGMESIFDQYLQGMKRPR